MFPRAVIPVWRNPLPTFQRELWVQIPLYPDNLPFRGHFLKRL